MKSSICIYEPLSNTISISTRSWSRFLFFSHLWKDNSENFSV